MSKVRSNRLGPIVKSQLSKEKISESQNFIIFCLIPADYICCSFCPGIVTYGAIKFIPINSKHITVTHAVASNQLNWTVCCSAASYFPARAWTEGPSIARVYLYTLPGPYLSPLATRLTAGTPTTPTFPTEK